MAKFDMAQFLSDAGVNLDTGSRKQTEYISIERIVPDPNNFYELSAIDDLAENIALFGLQQPIVVRPMPEDDARYIIVSGHRRHAALQKLIQEDGRDDLRDVWCAIDRGEENPKLNELKLIFANSSTRVVSSAEQAKQANKVEKLLYELKEEGMEFPGRMRDHVAAACNVSTGKLARLKVIRDGLLDFWQPLWESGEIRDAVAYELARIPKDRQYIIYSKFGKSKKNIADLTSDAIVTYNLRFERVDGIACKKGRPVCSNKYNMQKKALEVSRWYECECKQCCSECRDLAACKHACIMMRDKQQKIRREKQEREVQRQREAEERDRPDVEYIRGVYSRFGLAMDAIGLTIEQVSKKIVLPYSEDAIVRMINGSGNIDSHARLPFSYGFYLSDAKAVCEAADLLGCSIDYLLGRTDTPTDPAAPAAAPEKCVQFDTWHTGYPDAPGVYAVFADGGSYLPDVLALAWDGEKWTRTEIDDYDIEVDGDIVGWVRLPDKFPSAATEESE